MLQTITVVNYGRSSIRRNSFWMKKPLSFVFAVAESFASKLFYNCGHIIQFHWQQSLESQNGNSIFFLKNFKISSFV